MNLMIMHRHDARTEAGEKPPMKLITEMGAFIGGYAQAGKLLGGDGLGPSKTRTRLTFREGRSTVKHGPYAGGNELPQVIWTLKVDTREQAIGWAERYGKIIGDGELELGLATEAWDLGIMPKPDPAPPMRFLMIEKADQASEAGQPRSAKQKAELSRLATEMTKAGVLLSSGSLTPSAEAKRLVFTNHKLAVHDGPFTESKELIGGYAILVLESIDEAITVCKRYAEILGGTLEIDVRPVADAEPVS
jgi:hypothetical protein